MSDKGKLLECWINDDTDVLYCQEGTKFFILSIKDGKLSRKPRGDLPLHCTPVFMSEEEALNHIRWNAD